MRTRSLQLHLSYDIRYDHPDLLHLDLARRKMAIEHQILFFLDEETGVGTSHSQFGHQKKNITCWNQHIRGLASLRTLMEVHSPAIGRGCPPKAPSSAREPLSGARACDSESVRDLGFAPVDKIVVQGARTRAGPCSSALFSSSSGSLRPEIIANSLQRPSTLQRLSS
jgi:hypothetical protein